MKCKGLAFLLGFVGTVVAILLAVAVVAGVVIGVGWIFEKILGGPDWLIPALVLGAVGIAGGSAAVKTMCEGEKEEEE